MAKTGRVKLFGIEIDPLRMPQAVERVMGWLATPGDRCRYVVTPNCDHVVLLEEDTGLQAAYRDADLVLVDGMPVVWASRLLQRPLPERVTGADLVPALFDAARRRESSRTLEACGTVRASGDRPPVGVYASACPDRIEPEVQHLSVYLLGALPGVAERAAAAVEAKWPHVRVVGTYSPPFGFERSEAETRAILARIAAVKPDVLVVGLGAPKQELWVHAHRDRLRACVALCVGATIDFLAGEKARAPLWMRRCGLEWLHRMLSEPRRLVRRYARDARVFPRLVWREWRTRSIRPA